MKVAFVSSEAFPFVKTGGLGDVAGVLPKALEELGCEVKLFIPKYSFIDEDKFDLKYNWDVGEMSISINGVQRAVHLHQAVIPKSNVEVNFIDCPHYFHRAALYTNDHDEDERFFLFCKGVLETLQRLNWKPDIIHCNDWQSGVLPYYMKNNYKWDSLFKDTASVFSIHNIGYQGRFHQTSLSKGDIKEELFYSGGPVELENAFSFLKTGISYSDVINTVSKTYAHEILTPEYGSGLDPALRSRENDIYGILNGVDYSIWNPETDRHLPYKYSANDLSGKLKNKKFLLEHLSLPFNENVPVVGIVARMTWQKGFDLFAEVAHNLMGLNALWVVLGNGEDNYERMFKQLANEYPNKMFAYIGFNNELSHIIEAGSDIFLMPSRYEPCGLNQIYSLKYGTVPVVRNTGGLADTVQDWDHYKHLGEETGTGFSFNDYTGYALFVTVERAIRHFNDKENWKKIQLNGMAKEFSWSKAAKEYMELYKIAQTKKG